jgi:hypothetical protein
MNAAHLISDTRRWLERAVIGLNLCPFAKAVNTKNQIHYAVCMAAEDADVMDALLNEAESLLAMESVERDTTLLIVPNALNEFLDFNDFAVRAERRLAREGFEGVLQLATFHPDFQFAGSDADDIANATNRAPYPTLHLLREDSVSRAVDAFPEADEIFERNMRTLETLGHAGWKALDVGRHGAKP